MEESRLKQEADAKKNNTDKMETDTNPGSGEDDLLQQALALSLSQQEDKSGIPKMPDLSSMTEEEQLHYALQMSMAATGTTSTTATEKNTPVDAEMKDVYSF